MKSMIINVEGMSCGGCANTVQSVLKKMDSVIDATADFENDIVTIEYDATEPSMDSLKDAVANAGYQLVD